MTDRRPDAHWRDGKGSPQKELRTTVDRIQPHQLAVLVCNLLKQPQDGQWGQIVLGFGNKVGHSRVELCRSPKSSAELVLLVRLCLATELFVDHFKSANFFDGSVGCAARLAFARLFACRDDRLENLFSLHSVESRVAQPPQVRAAERLFQENVAAGLDDCRASVINWILPRFLDVRSDELLPCKSSGALGS